MELTKTNNGQWKPGGPGERPAAVPIQEKAASVASRGPRSSDCMRLLTANATSCFFVPAPVLTRPMSPACRMYLPAVSGNAPENNEN
jgi:hypothetical protein